jgi:hypothetical protein
VLAEVKKFLLWAVYSYETNRALVTSLLEKCPDNAWLIFVGHSRHRHMVPHGATRFSVWVGLRGLFELLLCLWRGVVWWVRSSSIVRNQRFDRVGLRFLVVTSVTSPFTSGFGFVWICLDGPIDAVMPHLAQAAHANSTILPKAELGCACDWWIWPQKRNVTESHGKSEV